MENSLKKACEANQPKLIHGATEGDSKTKEEQDEDDKNFVEKLLKDSSY